MSEPPCQLPFLADEQVASRCEARTIASLCSDAMCLLVATRWGRYGIQVGIA